MFALTRIFGRGVTAEDSSKEIDGNSGVLVLIISVLWPISEERASINPYVAV